VNGLFIKSSAFIRVRTCMICHGFLSNSKSRASGRDDGVAVDDHGTSQRGVGPGGSRVVDQTFGRDQR
jgi:hypothetical protein